MVVKQQHLAACAYGTWAVMVHGQLWYMGSYGTWAVMALWCNGFKHSLKVIVLHGVGGLKAPCR